MFLQKFDRINPAYNFTFHCDPKAVKKDSAKVVATLIGSAEEDAGEKLAWELTVLPIGAKTNYELRASRRGSRGYVSYFIQWEAENA